MKIIILAGGGGARLFPLSRKGMPKQFLAIDSEKSLFIETVERFKNMIKPSDIIVVTNKDYLHHVKTELVACGADEAHIVLEPVARNTAPAIALAARYCMDKLHCDAEEILFVSASDHIIKPAVAFQNSVEKALDFARQGKFVTFGIKPTKPETGFGYIEAGISIGDGYIVNAFKEKPDSATAEKYIARDNYYWNSGLFAFTIDCYFEEIRRYAPDIVDTLNSSYEDSVDNFECMPDISIDYAVAEKSKCAVVLPLKLYWNDVGSWDAIYDVLDKDVHGNALRGDCISIDSSNSLMLGQSRLIAGIGLDDIMIVETPDVILVAKKGESQKVKTLVDTLKVRGRKEATEHTTMYCPWGSYTILGEGTGYKMRKIIVNPGNKIDLQLHYHHSEHWIVTSGTAKVTIGEKKQMLHDNESVFIPISTKHCLQNPGKIPLELIEIQNGKYLEDDDIVLFIDEGLK